MSVQFLQHAMFISNTSQSHSQKLDCHLQTRVSFQDELRYKFQQAPLRHVRAILQTCHLPILLFDAAAVPAIPKDKLAGQNRNYKFIVQTVRRSAYNAEDQLTLDNSAETILRTRLKEILINYTKPNWIQNSKKSAKCIPQHQLFVYLKYGIMKIQELEGALLVQA